VQQRRQLGNSALAGAAAFIGVSALLDLGLNSKLDQRGRAFVALGGFHLWEMLLALELTVWLLALPGAIAVVVPFFRTRSSRMVLLSALALFFAILTGPFWYTVSRGEMTLPLTWGEHKIGIVWSLSAVAHSIILASLVATGLRAESSARSLRSGQLTQTEAVKELFEIRALAESMLTRAGIVLTLAVLGTGALYHLVDGARSLGSVGATWTPENVLGFGIYNTAVIALAYFPAAEGVQSLSALIRDVILSSADASNGGSAQDAAAWLKKHKDLDAQLQTEFDLAKTMGKAIPILAPLVTGILSLARIGK